MNQFVQLIHCINCHAIYLKTPFDQWPEYESHSFPSADKFRHIERDDLQDFLRDHRGHHLEDLEIIEDSFMSEKPYDEPVKVSYFRATNGRESFVIKKFRERIGDPLKYQLIVGDYFLRCTGIEIQATAIAKQLEKDFKASPISAKKVDDFVKLYHHISETVDIKNLERIPEESPNPSEIYCKMDDFSLMNLLRNCRNIFEGQEYSNIKAFIHRHKDNGVLLLKATHQIEITEKTQPERRPFVGQMPSAKKRVIEKR